MKVESIKEYGKLYNEGLYTPLEKDIMKEEELPKELQGIGIKAYNAGTDFKMLVRVMKKVSDNSEQRWNNFKGKTKTDYMCVSYIRNDMQATYAKDPAGDFGEGNDLTFGFRSMDEGTLLYVAHTDIGSYEDQKEKNNENKITEGIVNDLGYGTGLYTPDKLIKSMIMSSGYENGKHNELGYKRIQNGEIKQPDYIVVSVKDGLIDVKPELLMQVINDWNGELPIVIIDVDKCLEVEKSKVLEMFQRYKNGETIIEQDIIDKIRTNMLTKSNFCSDVLKELYEIRYGQNNQEIDKIQEKTNDSIYTDYNEDNLSMDVSKEADTDTLKAKIETFCRYNLATKGKDHGKAETLFKDKCKAQGLSWLNEYEKAYQRAVARKKCNEYYMLPNNQKTREIAEDLKKKLDRAGLDAKNELLLAEKRYWAITRMKSRKERGIAITDDERNKLAELGLDYEVDILGTLPIGLAPEKHMRNLAISGKLRDVQTTTADIKNEYENLINPHKLTEEDKNKS